MRIGMFLGFWSLVAEASFVKPAVSSSAPVASDSRRQTFSWQADRLSTIRLQVSRLEQKLLEGSKQQKSLANQVSQIQELQKLHRLEQSLGRRRLAELEKTLTSLQSRKSSLEENLQRQKLRLHKHLSLLEFSHQKQTGWGQWMGHFQEVSFFPRQRLFRAWVNHGLKGLETLRADWADVAELEQKIQEEKQKLSYFFNELREQESLLEFNRQLQTDVLKKKHHERFSQLKRYRELKNSEMKIEKLIGNLNARQELERSLEEEKQWQAEGPFAVQKGKLPLPIQDGTILSQFGRGFDPLSGLYIFKKGIDISSRKQQPVHAISTGKIVYAGELSAYGQVVMIDHGEHFYSLCARLGNVLKKPHESVNAGEIVGTTDSVGTPLYFEIRARNVAVNPLQWVYHESTHGAVASESTSGSL